MKTILAASVAVLSLAGVAAAQEVPAFYGDYASNVLNVDKGQSTAPRVSYDVSSERNATVPQTDGFNINASQNYSGK